MSLYRDIVVELIKTTKSKMIAEIGIYGGDLSRDILSKCSIDLLYMIDPWREENHNIVFEDKLYVNSRLRSKRRYKNQANMDAIYSYAMDSVKNYSNIRVLRMTSLDAAKEIQDNSLDFIFIDASHFYVDVKNDILAWTPKLKTGGILSGDDYNESIFPGVVKAVNELVPGFKLNGRVWWYVK